MSRFPQSNKHRGVMLAGGISLLLFGLLARACVKGSGSPERLGRVVRENLVQRATIAGTVEPLRSTVITAPYDGYLKRFYVRLGQKVNAGDPVFTVAQSLQAAENTFPLRAPFAGTVTQILKGEGQFAKQGDAKEFILRIDDLTKLSISASVPEIDVTKIKSGLEAVVKVSAVLSHNYRGVVRDIAQAATTKDQWGGRAQVEFQVKIEIVDEDDQLKPGMSTIVDIITAKKEGALVLGHEFIHTENGEHFVVLKNGIKRPVKLGIQNESHFEITGGLSEGQEVRQIDFIQLVEAQ